MDFLRDGLLWLDAPVRWGTVAWLAFGGTFALACLPGGSGGRRGWWGSLLFGLALVATLVAFRWPAWFSPDEFNPDESQIIAGAITLQEHPLYWKYVDGGTHGPVSEYLLVVAAWLGAPLNHATARIMATLLQALSLIAAWQILRNFTSERAARFGVLPGVAFWSFTAWVDLLHYGTELPGVALLSLAAWAVAGPLAGFPTVADNRARFFFAGFALGLIPLTKLQLIPLAAGLVLAVAGVLVVGAHRTQQPRLNRPFVGFMTGLFAPGIMLLIYLGAFGLLGQFWRAYVVSGLAYSSAGHHPLHEMPSWFFHFSATDFAFAWFFWGSISFALLFTRNPCPPAIRVARHLAWGCLGLALYCVLRPSREVAHYLHILVIPLTVLCGLVLAGAVAEGAPGLRLTRFMPWLALVLLALLPQVHFRTIVGAGYAGNLPANLAKPRSAAANYLIQHRQPGDALAMWGWEPVLFVETGMPQGTREAVTAYQLSPWPLQRFYIERYRRDLLERRPTWFVDAVGPGAFVYDERHATGHETIPAIRDVIARDYELVADLSSKRIYRLKTSAAVPP